jgi:hypothetical protein
MALGRDELRTGAGWGTISGHGRKHTDGAGNR